jgi:hypothetical protein
MRPLTPREKRTVRLGTVAVAIYLVCFCGLQAGKYLAKRRQAYQALMHQAAELKQEIRLYEDRIVTTRKLMEEFRLDPAKLSPVTVVAEASAAIQKSAMGSGVQLGQVREAPGRPSSKELASIQLEAVGQVPAVMGFLKRLESVGFPLIVDSVQLTSDMRPGQLKMSLTILVLDFTQWKKEEAPHA